MIEEQKERLRQFTDIVLETAQVRDPKTGAGILLSRLRTTEGSGLRHEVRCTSNPGGVGHNFVRTRWAIPDDGSASERRDPVTGFRRVFRFRAGRSAQRPLVGVQCGA